MIIAIGSEWWMFPLGITILAFALSPFMSAKFGPRVYLAAVCASLLSWLAWALLA